MMPNSRSSRASCYRARSDAATPRHTPQPHTKPGAVQDRPSIRAHGGCYSTRGEVGLDPEPVSGGRAATEGTHHPEVTHPVGLRAQPRNVAFLLGRAAPRARPWQRSPPVPESPGPSVLVVGAGRHTLHGVAAIGGGLRETVVAAVGRGGHHHRYARRSVLGASTLLNVPVIAPPTARAASTATGGRAHSPGHRCGCAPRHRLVVIGLVEAGQVRHHRWRWHVCRVRSGDVATMSGPIAPGRPRADPWPD
jgi:hypothetical protein